jgi:hypothetical protein
MDPAASLPDNIDALRAELAAERAARREAEARASGTEAMVAHLKLMIAKLEHHRVRAYGPQLTPLGRTGATEGRRNAAESKVGMS